MLLGCCLLEVHFLEVFLSAVCGLPFCDLERPFSVSCWLASLLLVPGLGIWGWWCFGGGLWVVLILFVGFVFVVFFFLVLSSVVLAPHRW